MPEVYEEGVWKRAVRLSSGKLIPVTLQSTGTIEEPKIEVKIFQDTKEQEKKELTKILNELFSFSKDLTTLYSFMDRDPISSRPTPRTCAITSRNLPVPAAHLPFIAKSMTLPS